MPIKKKATKNAKKKATKVAKRKPTVNGVNASASGTGKSNPKNSSSGRTKSNKKSTSHTKTSKQSSTGDKGSEYSSNWCRCGGCDRSKRITIPYKECKHCCGWKKQHQHCSKCGGTLSVG